MHAIRHYEFGPADVLRLESLPDPVPATGQVRIAVEAAGVHLLDTSIRAGEAFGTSERPELPMIPGREVAGVVDAVGTDVDRAWLDRRVVAHLGFASGGYAERAVVDAHRAHEIPEALDAATAVAAIGTGRTATAILELAEPTPDDIVVVTSEVLTSGDLSPIDAMNPAQMAQDAGNSAHEVRTWVAAFAALAQSGPYEVTSSYYRPIKEYIAGFGVMTARTS